MLITCLKIMVFGSLTNVELINVGIEVTKDVERQTWSYLCLFCISCTIFIIN